MTSDILQVAGGLGIFLAGMHLLTRGLKGLAGDALRHTLARFTNSPVSGAVTGAASTALLQSSSATTVAAVGFVSAGLLTFPQALGIIFGANLGTTITGWIVALLGFKLQIGQIVLPLILIGAMLQLFSEGRRGATGSALAGFGLLFVGIDMLQSGMVSYEGQVTPAQFPDDTFSGRLLLVAIGIAITLVTQSSSAGVATAMAALHAGTINFPQAAAMVIGMDVGTTVTALIATIGGSAEARRTGYSHVVYNLMTAIGALLLMTPFAYAWDHWIDDGLAAEPEFALVAFHSLFNAAGVLVILPFTGAFARVLYKLVPQRRLPLIDALDRRVLDEPGVALTLIDHSLRGLFMELAAAVNELLAGQVPSRRHMENLAIQLDTVHSYTDDVQIKRRGEGDWLALVAAVHALDHMQRLHERVDEEPERPHAVDDTTELRALASGLSRAVEGVRAALRQRKLNSVIDAVAQTSERFEAATDEVRVTILSEVAADRLSVSEGTRRLEAFRWLRRVSYHLWRITLHLDVLHRSVEQHADNH